MNRAKNFALFSIILLVYLSLSGMAYPVVYAQRSKFISKDKFDPSFFDKVSKLEQNGTKRRYTIIIRLVNKTVKLKEYARSLIETNHRATITYVGEVLPVIIARAPISEVKNIADYDFVTNIGDGEAIGEYHLDVSAPTVRANETWSLGYNGTGVRFAILDSGIDDSHPVFQGKTIIFRDFYNNLPEVIKPSNQTWDDPGIYDRLGHGTHVASIAVGNDPNDEYDGVAFGVDTLIFGAIGETIPVPSNVTAAFDWALSRGAQVICCSFGLEDAGDGTSSISLTADDAVDEGVVVVASAGNSGPYGYIPQPGDAFNVITVGAINDNNTAGTGDDLLWDRSDRGPTTDGRRKPDVVAPGINLWSADPISLDSAVGYSLGAWSDFGGTSAAAPHVSGIAALILQAHPDWTPNLVKDAVK